MSRAGRAAARASVSPRLDLDAVSVVLGGRRLLSEVTAQFPGPALVGLVGPNGAGKTTLLRAAAGLVGFTGAARLDGAPLATMRPRARAARVAYLPQRRDVHWPIAAEEVVRLGLDDMGGGAGASDRDAAARAALLRVGAEDLAARDVTRLSGGERARVLLARALAPGRGVLLADEPTAELDPHHQLTIMAALAAERDRGALVIATLHDLTLALRWCDRVICLAGGRLVADGPPDAVLTPALARAVFGVRAARARIDDSEVFAVTGLA